MAANTLAAHALRRPHHGPLVHWCRNAAGHVAQWAPCIGVAGVRSAVSAQSMGAGPSFMVRAGDADQAPDADRTHVQGAAKLLRRGTGGRRGASWKALRPLLDVYEGLEDKALTWARENGQRNDDAEASAGDAAWTVRTGAMITRLPVVKPLAPDWMADAVAVQDEVRERFNVHAPESLFQVETDTTPLVYHRDDTEMAESGLPVRTQDGDLPLIDGKESTCAAA